MNHRTLGRSGLQVSPLCLGSMMFGGATDEADSRSIVARAREQGVNFIDTADVYNEGRSEEVVGRAIAADRDWWVLATKLANPTGTGPNARGLSRRYAFLAVEASLKRLATETIDVLYLHKEDHATPLEETVGALADLIRAGKIRYFGLSNYRAWRVAEICRLCDLAGIGRPVVSQPLYNALNRMVEVEHLPACAQLGLGVADGLVGGGVVLVAAMAEVEAEDVDAGVGEGADALLGRARRAEGGHDLGAAVASHVAVSSPSRPGAFPTALRSRRNMLRVQDRARL